PPCYRCGKALGPVESIQEHPRDGGRLLIGYSRGLVVLWEQNTRVVQHLFLGNQQLESLAWEQSGKSIVSSHSDGGYMVWAVSGAGQRTQQPVMSTIPYGPFPCKAISKILWRTCDSGNPFIIFNGGMPRASYGDRHCVSVLQGQTLATLDFTSRVIDFFTVQSSEATEGGFENPHALVVLVEEELVAIDLQTPGWPTIPAPYLAPLHSSAITCSCHVSNVPLKLWERIVSAGEQQSPRLSSAAWPIDGGKNLAQEPTQRGLLLTGHEDGTVRFWDASGVSLKPLYKLGTASIFQTDCEHNDSLNQAGEEEWPPFRKVGCFDPYSDDPRLGVQKIALCKYTAKMVVAGTAGQVLVMELSDEKSEHAVSVATVDLLQDREGFTWKGHDRLAPRNGPLPFAPGFQPSVLVQCVPPAAVTAVTLHSEWNLVAFGTSHGFGLFDYYRRNPVLARCTLHPNDSLAMEGPLSRVKSLKKSLRQSFRRIRKSRVSGKKRLNASSPSSKVQEANAQLAEQVGPPEVEMTPVQRRIEPRSADDSLSGVVRCLYFADTFLRDGETHPPSLGKAPKLRLDISGIASCVFTKHGQGFYLISPSEFERFSLSARNVTEPLCRLEVTRLQDTSCLRGPALGPAPCRGCSPQPSPPHGSPGSPEEHLAAFSPGSIDSPNSSMENPLDTTGDITVEEVKDFLASSEEAERNLRNASEDEARPAGILIK
uniref:LLGL scribble cell polarity complex component 1 n=1 Tax=Athene cunicularia TaxID=194338 RepID=A0A663NC62_ATHCN